MLLVRSKQLLMLLISSKQLWIMLLISSKQLWVISKQLLMLRCCEHLRI